MTRQRRRRFPIVNKSIQYRFLAMTLVHSFSLILCIGLFLFLPDILEMYSATATPEMRLAAANRVLLLHSRLWPVLIVLVCLIALHSFYSLHRIVGPLYRFRVTFDRIQKGELHFTVRLRKGDYLGEEEEGINRMIEALREKWQDVKDRGSRSIEKAEALEEHLRGEAPDPQKALELCRAHRKGLDELISVTDYFRLKENPESCALTGQPQND